MIAGGYRPQGIQRDFLSPQAHTLSLKLPISPAHFDQVDNWRPESVSQYSPFPTFDFHNPSGSSSDTHASLSMIMIRLQPILLVIFLPGLDFSPGTITFSECCFPWLGLPSVLFWLVRNHSCYWFIDLIIIRFLSFVLSLGALLFSGLAYGLSGSTLVVCVRLDFW